MLEDLKKDIINMPEEEKAKYHVVEVAVTWEEEEEEPSAIR